MCACEIVLLFHIPACVVHECVLSVEQTFVNEICLIGSVCVCVHDMEEMDMKQYGVFGGRYGEHY